MPAVDAVVRAMATAAAEIGLKVIMEGIETPTSRRRYACELGCRLRPGLPLVAGHPRRPPAGPPRHAGTASSPSSADGGAQYRTRPCSGEESTSSASQGDRTGRPAPTRSRCRAAARAGRRARHPRRPRASRTPAPPAPSAPAAWRDRRAGREAAVQLRQSTGSVASRRTELWPVPKSSRLMATPAGAARSRWPRTAGSSVRAVSVISSTSCSEPMPEASSGDETSSSIRAGHVPDRDVDR